MGALSHLQIAIWTAMTTKGVKKWVKYPLDTHWHKPYTLLRSHSPPIEAWSLLALKRGRGRGCVTRLLMTEHWSIIVSLLSFDRSACQSVAQDTLQTYTDKKFTGAAPTVSSGKQRLRPHTSAPHPRFLARAVPYSGESVPSTLSSPPPLSAPSQKHLLLTVKVEFEHIPSVLCKSVSFNTIVCRVEWCSTSAKTLSSTTLNSASTFA